MEEGLLFGSPSHLCLPMQNEQKTHKNDKLSRKMSKNLRMSKKSSTFAR